MLSGRCPRVGLHLFAELFGYVPIYLVATGDDAHAEAYYAIYCCDLLILIWYIRSKVEELRANSD